MAFFYSDEEYKELPWNKSCDTRNRCDSMMQCPNPKGEDSKRTGSCATCAQHAVVLERLDDEPAVYSLYYHYPITPWSILVSHVQLSNYIPAQQKRSRNHRDLDHLAPTTGKLSGAIEGNWTCCRGVLKWESIITLPWCIPIYFVMCAETCKWLSTILYYISYQSNLLK